MPAAQKKAPKLNIGERARDVKRILKDIEGLKAFPRMILAAEATGWFTDGRMVFRMTDSEKTLINTVKRRTKLRPEDGEEFDKPLDVLSVVPASVGPGLTIVRAIPRDRAEGFCERPPLVEVATFTKKTFLIEGWRYMTLMERHPKATMYLDSYTPAPDRQQLVVFSESGKIQAVVVPFLMTEDFTPLPKG